MPDFLGEDEMAIPQTKMERIVNSTVAVGITRLSTPFILAILVWIASSVVDLRENVGKIDERTADVYTKNDAMKDFALRDALIARNTTDMTKIFGMQQQFEQEIIAMQLRMNAREQRH